MTGSGRTPATPLRTRLAAMIEPEYLADLLAEAAQREAEAPDIAEALYRQAAAAHPQRPEPYHYLGGALARRDAYVEAEAAYRRVLALSPDAAASVAALAVLLLARGCYPEGFRLWEARHAQPRLARPSLPQPEWRGEPLARKKLLVWPEQGLGDQIMFARFIPVLQAQGADVTILCPPSLTRLLAANLTAEVVTAAGAVEFPDPDFWVMTCSLAGRLGITSDSIPAEPYLHALAPPPPLPAGFKIGLVTSGSPAHGNDRHRSLPPGQAERLLKLPTIVVPLDPKHTGATDFADTAAIISGLDLVITVDTSVAHLAGAMGKPCWILLPAVDTDWRWMRKRADTPWYPSARLYRQPGPGRWSEVMDRVSADLEALMRSPDGP